MRGILLSIGVGFVIGFVAEPYLNFSDSTTSDFIVTMCFGILIWAVVSAGDWILGERRAKAKKKNNAFDQTFTKPAVAEPSTEPVPALVEETMGEGRVHELVDQVVRGYWDKFVSGEWDDERGN